MFTCWVLQVLYKQETADVMLNISIAILTIFIPVAVALFFEPKEEQSYAALDKAVILDHLINGPQILWQISLLFLPLFLWQIKYLPLHFLALILWGIGIYLVIMKLGHVYTWIRGNKFPYRFAHLKTAPINSDAENLWRSVWDTSSINFANEQEFFSIFKEKINSTLIRKESGELTFLVKLLQDFEIFVDKRDPIFLTSPDDVFQQVLDWHYQIWREEQQRLGNEAERGLWRYFYTLAHTLDQIIKKIISRMLKSDRLSYGFFDLLKKHIEKHKEDSEKVGDNAHFYMRDFLGVFYPTFLELIEDASDQYDIWEHYFPQLLKITEENIKYLPARISLYHYLEWARDRINRLGPKTEYDGTLENVTMELFPSTEPIFWSIMMTLLLRSWGDKGRMATLVEKERNFGLRGRIMGWTRDVNDPEPDIGTLMQEERESSLQNSISLLIRLFPLDFTLETVNKYIDELEGLNYTDEERKENRRKQILEYLKRIKQFIESSQK